MDSDPEKLQSLLTALTENEKKLHIEEDALRSATRRVAEQMKTQETIAARLFELGIGEKDDQAIATATQHDQAVFHRINELIQVGESFSLGLAQASMLATLAELTSEAETLRRELGQDEMVIAERNRTGELAQDVIEALREASLAVVEKRLEQIGPVLQNIYSRIDAHPAFRVVRFTSRIYNKKRPTFDRHQ